MSRSTNRTTFRRRAERELPHKVDVEVPPTGLGTRLNEMLAWCRQNVSDPADWAQHGHTERPKGEAPQDFARFYFRHAADSAAFRLHWPSN